MVMDQEGVQQPSLTLAGDAMAEVREDATPTRKAKPKLTAEERRDALVRLLEPVVAQVPGARLEIEPASVAVHVREVADRPAAAALLAQADALADPSLTKKPGKEVLELAVTAADKGAALQRLRAEVGAAAAIYLGDDVTDEDAFRALPPGDVAVKVGEGPTVAPFRVADVPGAVALLDRLGDLLA